MSMHTSICTLMTTNMNTIILLVLSAVAVSASPTSSGRIVGGALTTINNYPTITATLYSSNLNWYSQYCGGTILNQRSIMTAAHCFDEGRNVPARWRFRVGSSFASSGGTVYAVSQIIRHPNYREWWSIDNDIAIMRSASTIAYVNNAVQPASIASANYNLADNQVVWAAGWGATESASSSEQLRHVQVWTINQAICRQRYPSLTDNMLCSGWLDVGGRDQCQGDSGGPLYHNNVVVGVCSWGNGCALPAFPGVNVRVSRYTSWIQSNA